MDLAVAIIFGIGSVICHQIPERSFFWGIHQLPVCARCTGLYLSALVGFMAWMGVTLARRWRPIAIDSRTAVRVLMIAALPTLLSLAAGFTGVWHGSNVMRAMLAIPLGASSGAIVAAVFTKDLR